MIYNFAYGNNHYQLHNYWIKGLLLYCNDELIFHQPSTQSFEIRQRFCVTTVDGAIEINANVKSLSVDWSVSLTPKSSTEPVELTLNKVLDKYRVIEELKGVKFILDKPSGSSMSYALFGLEVMSLLLSFYLIYNSELFSGVLLLVLSLFGLLRPIAKSVN
ncbi:hypothetical protein [Psychrobium sp. 1_MG-2023]|uniref:hypothetical protein n=1 Tax=Psychrobium sp. 1_MG-2023 TaxID=3062624 RepID=UPI000C33A1BD|nr:hypothetical protein [Psychrobium sp. 1_MG-2023]MDP2562295.1 hypothetical protein [Psychrobium sp. 1_MG-2023]PKF54678.1 hypothetical protein CW748_15585 [Alteromonadales bacterium alter-6D02]